MENNLIQTTGENSEMPIQSESTIFAEPIFKIGNFTVTNSLINSWVAVFVLIVVFLLIGRKIKKIPKGLQNIFEILLEEALKLADSITGERKKSEKFLPIALTLFLFILVNNWLGLLPGIGTVGFIGGEGTHRTFIPFFRGGTADLNTTLALALFSVIASHILGVLFIGFWKHFNKFLNINSILEIPGKIKNDFTIVLVNPIKVFVGVIEIIGELAKVASLSFRLFGNIFAGEVLLASMMALFAFILPLPFMFLELIVGIIQALIFSVLTIVYMTIAATAEEH